MTAKTQNANRLIERVLASIGELPASPHVVSSIMGLTANLNTQTEELSHVLSADPALTAKVLRLSNSPFYGRARSVGSLDEAVMILGFFTIRSLVVATSAHSLFKRGSAGALEEALWHHSLAVGMGARITARRIGFPQIEEMFLAGLLHDIGILILVQKLPNEYVRLMEADGDNGMGNLAEEEKLLGFTHVDVGAIVLERWNFPEVLSAAVRHHHDPSAQILDEEDGGGSAAAHQVTHVVCFADALAHSLGYGLAGHDGPDLASLPSVEHLKLGPEDIAQIADELTERFTAEQELFEN